MVRRAGQRPEYEHEHEHEDSEPEYDDDSDDDLHTARAREKARAAKAKAAAEERMAWREYEFRYKPSNVDKRPPVIPGHMPSLDWRLWFLPHEVRAFVGSCLCADVVGHCDR